MTIEEDTRRQTDIVLARIMACDGTTCTDEERQLVADRIRLLRQRSDKLAIQRELIGAVTESTLVLQECGDALRATQEVLARLAAQEAAAVAVREAALAQTERQRGRVWQGVIGVGVWAKDSKWLPALMVVFVIAIASALGVDFAEVRAAIFGGAP